MDKRDIRRVKDTILHYADLLEVVQALIFNRTEIYTTGVYSERICLSDEIVELSQNILDSLVNDFRLLVESGFTSSKSDD